MFLIRILLVGTGAVGCEMVKLLALMGACCGPKGLLTCVDDDHIEFSNLTRQFLFKLTFFSLRLIFSHRKEDLGKSKAETACKSVKEINPDLKTKAYNMKMCGETADTFNGKFWEELDLIICAVDNLEGRKFIGLMSQAYQKKMLECGTEGVLFHTQVILPYITQPYANSGHSSEKSYPMCSVNLFPYKKEHTIEWARIQFEEIFVEGSRLLTKFLKEPLKCVQSLENEYGDQLRMLKAKVLYYFLSCLTFF